MGFTLFGFVSFCLCVSVTTSATVGGKYLLQIQILHVLLLTEVTVVMKTCFLDGFQLLTKALTGYMNTGVRPWYLDYALSQFPLPQVLRSHVEARVTDNDSQICLLCNLAADFLISQRKKGMTETQLAAEASYFCTTMKIENERVCDGIIMANIVRSDFSSGSTFFAIVLFVYNVSLLGHLCLHLRQQRQGEG